MKVRVPGAVKTFFGAIAQAEFTTESEVARRALLEYLNRRGITNEMLRREPSGKIELPSTFNREVAAMMFEQPSSKPLAQAESKAISVVTTYSKKLKKSAK